MFIMTALGLILFTVGIDPISGVARMTFEYPDLYSGIEFLTLAVGMFALGEVFKTIISKDYAEGEPIKVGRLIPSLQDMKGQLGIHSARIVSGFFPGTDPRLRRDALLFVHGLYDGEEVQQEQGEFRKGRHSGRCCAGSCQQWCCRRRDDSAIDAGDTRHRHDGRSDGRAHPVQHHPRPSVIPDNPKVVWGLIASMLVGNVMLLVLNLPLVKVFAKVIETPPKYLIPGILAISVFGVYAVQSSLFNLWLMLGSGVAAYFLAKHDYPIAPLVLSLILGPLIENNLAQSREPV